MGTCRICKREMGWFNSGVCDECRFRQMQNDRWWAEYIDESLARIKTGHPPRVDRKWLETDSVVLDSDESVLFYYGRATLHQSEFAWANLHKSPLVPTDYGPLVLTQRRLLFLGRRSTVVVNLQRVKRVWMEPSWDGIDVVGLATEEYRFPIHFGIIQHTLDEKVHPNCPRFNQLLKATLVWALQSKGWVVRGADRYVDVLVDQTVATLGGETDVVLRTEDGERILRLRIPPNTVEGTRIRCRGWGHPGLHGGAPGDAIVRVRIRGASQDYRLLGDQNTSDHGDKRDSAARFYLAARRNVVYVHTDCGTGSAVLVDRRGYLVTNYHVVRGAQWLGIQTADGMSFVPFPVAARRATDLAILSAPGLSGSSVEFADTDVLFPGEDAYAVGYPLGIPGEPVITRGVVSRVRRDERGRAALIQFDAAVNPGNSGGALLDANARLLGIVYSIGLVPDSNERGEGIGYAIGVEVVRDVLSAAGIT